METESQSGLEMYLLIVSIISFVVGVVVIWSIVSIANSNVRIRRNIERLVQLTERSQLPVTADSKEDIARKAKEYDRLYGDK